MQRCLPHDALTGFRPDAIIKRKKKQWRSGGRVDITTAAAPPRAHRITAGTEIDVIEIGARRPLLFLHSGEGPVTFSDAMPVDWAAGWRCATVSL